MDASVILATLTAEYDLCETMLAGVAAALAILGCVHSAPSGQFLLHQKEDVLRYDCFVITFHIVKTGANTSDAVYNGWYSNVYQTEHAQVSAVLAGITIGSLQLTPAFDAGTTSYMAETVNDEDAVSATAASGTAVTILVNGAAHTSGSDATWESGTNTVTVIASKTGCTSTAYTVTVTKNGQG